MDNLQSEVITGQFVMATGCSREQASQFLTASDWHIETALSKFFQEPASLCCSYGRQAGVYPLQAPANTPATPPFFPDTLSAFAKMSTADNRTVMTGSPDGTDSNCDAEESSRHGCHHSGDCFHFCRLHGVRDNNSALLTSVSQTAPSNAISITPNYHKMPSYSFVQSAGGVPFTYDRQTHFSTNQRALYPFTAAESTNQYAPSVVASAESVSFSGELCGAALDPVCSPGSSTPPNSSMVCSISQRPAGDQHQLQW